MISNINISGEALDPSLIRSQGASPRTTRSTEKATTNADANTLSENLSTRLKDLSTSLEGQNGEIADGQAISQLIDSASASFLGRPATAMAAQANQTPASVVELLQ
jgi:hypothetical protein